MKKICLLILASAAAFGCGGNTTGGNNSVNNNTNKTLSNVANSTANNAVTVNNNAVQPKTTDLSQVYGSSTLGADERAATIQTYVDEIEARLPDNNQSSAASLQRREVMLTPDSLKGATDEHWGKLHVYSDGQTVKRVKVYAPEGSEKSEEFYFYDDKPVFVFLEPKGKNVESGDEKSVGDRFYFGNEGLFSWIKSDGSKPAATSEEFKKIGEKLTKEAAAFKAAK